MTSSSLFACLCDWKPAVTGRWLWSLLNQVCAETGPGSPLEAMTNQGRRQSAMLFPHFWGNATCHADLVAQLCFQLDVQIIPPHCCQVAAVVYTQSCTQWSLWVFCSPLYFLFRLVMCVVIRVRLNSGNTLPFWGQKWGSGLYSCVFKAPQWALTLKNRTRKLTRDVTRALIA